MFKQTLFHISGKGGVGKTTTALSLGIALAQKAPTLVLSTDPAHSLADSLDQDLKSGIHAIAEVPNLSVLEIDAQAALADFKAQHRAELELLLDTTTYLDEKDIDQMLALTIPGLDEVMSFKVLMDLIEAHQFTHYILDNAPTGHALRLLQFPELLDDWIKVMAQMRWKYRYVQQTFKGKYTPDDADDLLLSLKKMVKRTRKLLIDPQQSAFVLVSKPEAMILRETERLYQQLQTFGMPITHLILNNVMLSEEGSFCQQVKKEQAPYLKMTREKFEDLEIKVASLQPYEIRGLDRLRQYSHEIWGN